MCLFGERVHSLIRFSKKSITQKKLKKITELETVTKFFKHEFVQWNDIQQLHLWVSHYHLVEILTTAIDQWIYFWMLCWNLQCLSTGNLLTTVSQLFFFPDVDAKIRRLLMNSTYSTSAPKNWAVMLIYVCTVQHLSVLKCLFIMKSI